MKKFPKPSKITFLFIINNDHFNVMYLNTSLCLTLNISYHIIFLCVCCLVVLGASAMRCETRMIGMLRGLHSEVLTALSVRLLLSLARSRSPPLSLPLSLSPCSSFAFSLSLSLYLSLPPSLTHTPPHHNRNAVPLWMGEAATQGKHALAFTAVAALFATLLALCVPL